METKLRARRRAAMDADAGACKCRGGCGVYESLTHIVQRCALTHDVRCSRHNRIADLIRRKLTRKGYRVLTKPRVPYAGYFLKPDLVVSKGKDVCVINVTVVSYGRLDCAHGEKVKKYSVSGFDRRLVKIAGFEGGEVKVRHAPAVFTLRGLLFRKSEGQLRSLGLTLRDLSDLSLHCSEGILKCYDTYMRET